jgi:hypothetical protein
MNLSMRRHPIRIAVAAVLLLLIGLPNVANAAPSTPAPASPQVRAESIVKPSVVYVTIEWTGWIRLSSGRLLSTRPIEVTTACSGYVANSTGFVVTAGHCVDNRTMQGGKGAILTKLIQQMVDEDLIESGEFNTYLRTAEANWRVEGTEAGSAPDRKVSVYQSVAASGVALVEPFQATVVDFNSFNDGDVALMKVEPPNPMPALEIAGSAVESGTEILVAGYPGTVTDTVDPKLDPSFKDGRTSSRQTANGVPFTEISAATSAGMSGGPAVDMNGRVVGTVSFKPGGETQPFNFITATGTIQTMLARNGVSTVLGPQDQAYRAGLDAYFAGKYHLAVTEFDKVLATLPGHALAQSYRTKAVALYSTEDTGGTNGLLLWAGVALAVLLLGGASAVTVLLLRRRHSRPQTPGMAATAPVPEPMPTAGPAAQTPVPVERIATLAATPTPEATAPSPTLDARPILPTAYCPNCSTPHTTEAHFCASCGQPFPSAFSGDTAEARS